MFSTDAASALTALLLSYGNLPDTLSGNKLIDRTVFCTVVFLEDHSGCRKITVDFPISESSGTAFLHFHKSFYILGRISKKSPYLMWESHPLLCKISNA